MKAGCIIFEAGLYKDAQGNRVTALDGSVIFRVSGQEVLRLDPTGFYVENRKVTDDVDVYNSFCKWMSSSHLTRDPAVPEGTSDSTDRVS
jgi:hypothetical protein